MKSGTTATGVRRRRICACGHELAWHDAEGRCRYGHGSATGGCTCEASKLRGRDAPREPAKLKRRDAPDAADPALASVVAALVELHVAVERLAGPDLRVGARPPRRATNGDASALTVSPFSAVSVSPAPFSAVCAPPRPARSEASSPVASPTSASPNGHAELAPCAVAVLGAIARAFPRPLSADYVAIYTGYSVGSGSFAAALAQLRRAGLVTGSRTRLGATGSGLQRAGKQVPLPTGRALLDMWVAKLDPCAGAVLECLYLRRPEAMRAVDVAEMTGYSAGSGSFAAALAVLRKLELASGPSSALRIHESLRTEDRTGGAT